jgi:hypothetical protein
MVVFWVKEVVVVVAYGGGDVTVVVGLTVESGVRGIRSDESS